MDTTVIWVFGIFAIIIMIVAIIAHHRVIKDYKIAIQQQEECNAYLDTVKNRIDLSLSLDALILLNDELGNSSDKYTYHEDTYQRFKEYQWYLLGKATGLKRMSKIFK